MKFKALIPFAALLILACADKKEEDSKSLKASDDTVISIKQEVLEDPEFKIFQRLSSGETGIDFKNILQHNIKTGENLFDYDYFYNGAGIGVEDINNDGLKDIFFCGNQVPNKLFLNKGNLVFEDISESANINTGKGWANGVTFADVNQDGWLDIYVSQGGPKSKDQRKNLLFINQKDLTFKEAATAYNLADTGISTQSAFFDYDKDGDLDCIVMNESTLYGVGPVGFFKAIKRNKEFLENSSSRLYRNDGGKYTNITEKAGLLKPSFGLGLSISDINNDGWLDIYISNDYYIPDALYINNKNGTFTDRIKNHTNQISFFGMGVDIEDINNDGFQDIFVLDMASSDHYRSKTLMASMNVEVFDLLVDKMDFHHQYMFNSLQLNSGNHTFNNVSQATQLSKTDWSWAGLMADLNNDENKDIYVTNGYRRYALDNDLKIQVVRAKQQYNNRVPLEVKEALYNDMPSEKLANMMFKNDEDLAFKEVARDWGLSDPSFSNGAAYADLDNDGDLELVVNNIDEEAFVYKNLAVEEKRGNYLRVKTSGKNSEAFAKVSIEYNGKKQFNEIKRVRGYLSAVDNIAHFGLGNETQIDVVRVVWPSGKYEERKNVQANQLLTFLEKDAISKSLKEANTNNLFKRVANTTLNLDFIHKENEYNDFEKEVLLPYKQSTLGPFIAKGDINGDGKEDIFIGGAAGQAGAIYTNDGKKFKKLSNPVLTKDAKFEDMQAVFFDADNDNDNDLFVVSGGNAFDEKSGMYVDRLYLNDGKGNFSKSSNLFENYNGKSVTVIDFDKDGDKDLVVGNRIIPKHYPLPAPSLIYENENGTFKNVTASVAPQLEKFGIVNEVIASDFNNDGWEDLIVLGEWTGIGMFRNNEGTFEDVSSKNGLDKEKGWWFSVHETDINNDGFKDYVVGNVGANIKFKATKKNPLKVYANDFDANGTFDVVLSKKYKNEYVPVRGRECSSEQMPFISEKFQTYSEFANASLVDIYGEKLGDSHILEATNFKSMVLVNNGDGTFAKNELSVEAQLFPLLDVVFYDFNQDGYEDMIAAGNIYDTEVETPRLDNGSGLVLLSDTKGNYYPMNNAETGLYIEGDIKSLELINKKSGGTPYLLAAKNNADISIMSIKR